MTPEQTTTERVHHPYSPSKLQYLECCSSFESRQTGSEAARIGTLQHTVTETGVDNETLTDEEAAEAALCMDFFERQKQLLVEERLRAIVQSANEDEVAGVRPSPDSDFPQVVEFKEIYLPIDDMNTTAGYLDCGLISFDGLRAILADWKFGAFRVTETRENLQAIAYALGIFKAFPKVVTVDFYFKQPKLDSLCHAQWKREHIPALYLRVCTVVARAIEARKLGNFSTAFATVPGCSFCANIARCPRVAELVLSVGHKFYPAEVPASLEPADLEDPTQTAVGLRLASIVQTWSEAFKRRVNDRILQGAAPVPPGYKLTSSQRREVVNEKIFRDVALRHLTEQEFNDSLELQFGKIEKAVSAKAPRGSKTAALDSFKSALIEEGAVKLGEPFAFLKVDSSK